MTGRCGLPNNPKIVVCKRCNEFWLSIRCFPTSESCFTLGQEPIEGNSRITGHFCYFFIYLYNLCCIVSQSRTRVQSTLPSPLSAPPPRVLSTLNEHVGSIVTQIPIQERRKFSGYPFSIGSCFVLSSSGPNLVFEQILRAF